MRCKICDTITVHLFRRSVLHKYDADYFQCPHCKFIQTEEPYWLNEAYENSINIEDTGMAKRNIIFSKRTSLLLYFLFDRKVRYLDYGGGYGLFVRLMRDHGFDFYWTDPYTENIFARGFEHLEESKNNYTVVTTFECLEHFANPLKELETILSYSDTVIFSTEIFKNKAPLPDKWKYYYFSHGQHIAFYSLESLEYIAKKYNKKLYTNGKSFHMFTSKNINNYYFNFLLNAYLFGATTLIKMKLESKTNSDSTLLQNQRALI